MPWSTLLKGEVPDPTICPIRGIQLLASVVRGERGGCRSFDYRGPARGAFSRGVESGSRRAARIAEGGPDPGARRHGADWPPQGCRGARRTQSGDGDLSRLRSGNRGGRGNRIPAGQPPCSHSFAAPAGATPGRADRARDAGRLVVEAIRLHRRSEALQAGKGGDRHPPRRPPRVRRLPPEDEAPG